MVHLNHFIYFFKSCSNLQSHSQAPASGGSSLFSELEMSMSEADMNLHHHHSNSTPLKHGFYGDHDDGDVMSDEGVPDILVTTPNNREINRVRVALCV